KWKKAKEEAESRGEGANFKVKEPTFMELEADEVWDSLGGWIFGAKELREPGVEEDVEDLNIWKVMDLYLNLVPRELGSRWKHIFRTSKNVATYMAGKFVKSIEEFGGTELWGARCKTTVEREKCVGITTVSKRAWGYTGVGEHLGSSSDFYDLAFQQRSGTDTLELILNADDRVLKQYQGFLRLDVMERMGGFKSLLTYMVG
ncbi:hypothetical protein BG003_011165, partial [Podila horticola]